MITIDDRSPRWLRELGRFLPLKNLIFVHGNILDLISYPVRRPESGDVYWTETDLPRFFERFLTDQKYDLIGFFDPVDGLTFSNSESEKRFKQVRSGKIPPPEPAQAIPAAPRTETNTPTSPGSSIVKTDDSGSGSCCTATPFQVTPGHGYEGSPSQVSTPEVAPIAAPRPRSTAGDLNLVIDDVRVALRNTQVPCAFVFNLASRLVSSPAHMITQERNIFTKLLKASLEGADVVRGEKQWRNVLILICDKLNDLPAFLYLNNPRSRSIFIEKPDARDRERFIKRSYRAFYGADQTLSEAPAEIVTLFSALTDGLTYYEMKSLISLSRQENIPISRLQNICERYKYGINESEWDKINKDRLEASEEFLRSRIKGQGMAIARVLDLIKRARMGITSDGGRNKSRPKGVLFFAGPTGIGKTEMAKSLAELLFGQPDRFIRFDMSEYAAAHADQKLLGAPPGYVGYEEGGQLTNALKDKPFSVLLFDEIEKAHGTIFDKFLQILDEGRLTDGKGETVYFSESIIIFTSNLGTVTLDEYGRNQALISPETSYPDMKETVLKAIRDHFNFTLGRPEILNRFGDNFVVFDFIRPPFDSEIVTLLLDRIVQAAEEERKVQLIIGEPAKEKLLGLVRENLQHGGRGIRNTVESAFLNPLNRVLFDCEDTGQGATIRVTNLLDHGPNAPYRFELAVAVA